MLAVSWVPSPLEPFLAGMQRSTPVDFLHGASTTHRTAHSTSARSISMSLAPWLPLKMKCPARRQLLRFAGLVFLTMTWLVLFTFPADWKFNHPFVGSILPRNQISRLGRFAAPRSNVLCIARTGAGERLPRTGVPILELFDGTRGTNRLYRLCLLFRENDCLTFVVTLIRSFGIS
jgi:hypothetical protein